ncbi:hypothetical protein [Actinocorallia sp. A-T 12471]|uniref:hypothetical protein n=1 Tax=Actinocorallia sp. A-T 12471 TaxID=3089813 RepID=UPI0029CE0C14|nr:hypothetical protein [Actinocorallia sp. A-T 12471]MDX6744003.1 hypothetical protein [Actinocorallia sp. A-T 12471]
MRTPAKVGVYAAGLVAVFVAAYGLGGLVGDGGPAKEPATHHGASGPSGAAADTPGGLQVSSGGYTLDLETARAAAAGETPVRFTIRDASGKPVTAYETVHDKELHLIVADRDLRVFRHVHPTRDGAGVWSTTVDLPSAGSHRVFADFTPEGGQGLTLGADLAVPGEYRPAALPEPSAKAEADGYTVEMRGNVAAGSSSTVTFAVRKDGRPVAGLEPYLGAYGHLVALRAGDLAYLHVHPAEEAGAGVSDSPEVAFAVSAPSAGAYRLFLDVKIDGVVRTAAFTLVTGQATVSPSPVPSVSDGHGGHGDHTH